MSALGRKSNRTPARVGGRPSTGMFNGSPGDSTAAETSRAEGSIRSAKRLPVPRGAYAPMLQFSPRRIALGRPSSRARAKCRAT